MTHFATLTPWENFRLNAYRELGLSRCRCEHHKRLGQTFCSYCYSVLPISIRVSLTRAENYPRTYWRALEFLARLTPEEESLRDTVYPPAPRTVRSFIHERDER